MKIDSEATEAAKAIRSCPRCKSVSGYNAEMVMDRERMFAIRLSCKTCDLDILKIYRAMKGK